MPDSSNIDNAIVAKLGADLTLLGLMPNGVYPDEAPQDSTRFVIVSLIDEVDAQAFNARAFEDALYLVKAVARKKDTDPTPNVQAAAARIDALLENATLTVTGYRTMTVHREARIRITEVDEVDASIRWFHRGGQYRVVMSST